MSFRMRRVLMWAYLVRPVDESLIAIINIVGAHIGIKLPGRYAGWKHPDEELFTYDEEG